MNPFDLIPWAFAVGFSLVILAPAVAIITAAWSAGRRM